MPHYQIVIDKSFSALYCNRMKNPQNPFTIRLSDRRDQQRAEKFEHVLQKRGANPTYVIRHLVDAYIATDGLSPFPARLFPRN